MDAIKYDDYQGNGHNHTLDQICSGNCHEAAHDCIAYDNNRTNDHGNMVVSAKKTGKQCSDSFESGCRIRNKENKDDNGRNAHQDILIVLKTTGKEIGNSNGITYDGVTAQALRYDQPV